MGKRNNKKTPTKQQDEESKRPTVLDEDNGQQDKVVVDNEHSEEDDERVVKGVVALAGHTNKKNNKDHHYEESSSSSSSVEKSSEEENDEESSGSSNSSDDDDDDDDDDANNKNIIQVPSLSPTTVGGNSTAAGDEPCTLFDLRNLLAINAHPLFLPKLYNNNSSSTSTATILSQQQHNVIINEMYLLEKTEQNTNQLITELWELPMTSSGNNSGGTSQVPMVQLPPYEEIPIPRSLPPPPTNKVETKWEKFAKAKGIGQNQDKRSRKVWDETLGEWKYRHGYEKADNNNKEWPIMEANPNDPYEDPWEKQRNAKKANVRKNTEQKMKNQERSGQLAKGTTKRLLAAPVPPAGVPIDLKEERLRGPTSTMKALQQTQHSTASRGKFDRMRPDEPERRRRRQQNKKTSSTQINNDKKRKQQQTNTNTNNETERSQKVLRLLEKGGGVDEKASRRRLASTGGGETAYDYDFDDGLVGGKFRKKKGRAGMGKMKKMTKKRVK